jgi:hypothetical protein
MNSRSNTHTLYFKIKNQIKNNMFEFEVLHASNIEPKMFQIFENAFIIIQHAHMWKCLL